MMCDDIRKIVKAAWSTNFQGPCIDRLSLLLTNVRHKVGHWNKKKTAPGAGGHGKEPSETRGSSRRADHLCSRGPWT